MRVHSTGTQIMTRGCWIYSVPCEAEAQTIGSTSLLTFEGKRKGRKEKIGVGFGWVQRQQGEARVPAAARRRRRLLGTTTNLVEGRGGEGGDEGDRQGALRGRQGHRRRHPRRVRRRRPPPQGLRHRRRLRQRPLPQGPHPHPREARRIPPRPQATQPRCALPVHELGARARQARQPHLHPLHHPRSGPRPRRAAQPHRPRLHRHLRSGQQGQRRSHARLRRLPRQVHLRARRRPPHHHGALLRHSQQRLGVRRHQEVRGRGCSQGHLPRLQQAAGPRVEQGFQDWWIL